MTKKVLFVGSFLQKTATGGFGGQMFACTTLINSSLSNDIEWKKIDTTSINLKISIFKRIFKALIRLCKFIFYILFNKFTHILIFSSNGLSFIEKGLMAIIASKFTKSKIIFAPRSGRLKNEINTSRIKFIKNVFKSSDVVICQGNSWFKLFSEKVIDNNKKFIVQKNWIDTKKYRPVFNKSKKIIEILFLGSLEKDKGIFDLLIAGNYLLLNGITNFRFNIAGKGKGELELIAKIKEMQLSNYFVFFGWVGGDEKLRLFDRSHIFVLPSYFEGMPNALLESMASGLACLASNIDSINDVILEKNGVTFDRNNDIDFSRNLQNLVLNEELRLELGLNARKYIEQEHSIKTAVNNFKNNILN